MLDMATTGNAIVRVKKPAKAGKKRTKQTERVFVALADNDDYKRVFIATGTARQVSKLVSQANRWHSEKMRTVGGGRGRIGQRELAAVRRTIRTAHLHGHWYDYNDAIDALIMKYRPWPQ